MNPGFRVFIRFTSEEVPAATILRSLVGRFWRARNPVKYLTNG